jgi:hypothetical protein
VGRGKTFDDNDAASLRPVAFRQTAPGAARIEVGDTIQDVQLLARGDFNADGFEDWLLRVDSSRQPLGACAMLAAPSTS